MAKDWIAYWMARGETAERAAYLAKGSEALASHAVSRPCTTGYTRKVKDPFLQQMVLEETCCSQTEGFIPCRRL